MSDDNDDYEVGYGKPPKHSRWKPGQSGNHRGKEKGHKGIKTDLEAELNAIETVKGKDGWSKKGRQQRLAIATLCRRAANGDLKAQALLFPLILNIFGVEDRRTGPKALSDQDQAILDELLASRSDDDDEDALPPESGGDIRRLPPPSDAPLTDDDDEERHDA
jgi:hypothetical protein